MNTNAESRFCSHARTHTHAELWVFCSVWPATHQQLPLCVLSSRGPHLHRCPWCSVGMRGRADPFGPVWPKPRGVPGLSAWTISDRGHEQTHTGRCQCSPLAGTLDSNCQFLRLFLTFDSAVTNAEQQNDFGGHTRNGGTQSLTLSNELQCRDSMLHTRARQIPLPCMQGTYH